MPSKLLSFQDCFLSNYSIHLKGFFFKANKECARLTTQYKTSLLIDEVQGEWLPAIVLAKLQKKFFYFIQLNAVKKENGFCNKVSVSFLTLNFHNILIISNSKRVLDQKIVNLLLRIQSFLFSRGFYAIILRMTI